ncbi:MAG: glucosaminidase domain-containing protein [Bacteroidota bacterium]
MRQIDSKTILTGLLLLWVCSAAFASDVTRRYIDQYKVIAITEMQEYGIPASIKMAQAILESNSGRSSLAMESNNHFGIKCGKDWIGKKAYREDDDYENGLLVKSCFRAYDDPALSFRAHSQFLTNPKSQRYKFLFELDPYDYKGWAKGLRKAGYATDPNYPSKLIGIIERYELYLLDLGIMDDSQEPVIAYQESSPAPQATTDEYIVPISSTASHTDQTAHFTDSGRESSTQGTYVMMAGDQMTDIAERYNIDLRKLYIQNRMPFGTQPKAGEELKLDGYIHFGTLPETTDIAAVEDQVLWTRTISVGGK